MDAYKDHPARKRAQAAPKAATCPHGHRRVVLARSRRRRRGSTRSTRPTAATTTARRVPRAAGLALEGSVEGQPPSTITRRRRDQRLGRRDLEPAGEPRDRQRHALGVHTNMCVLGRPFGLRQMAKNGKNVVLVRDMTDTMYNPRSWPYVSHFEGTDRIVEHIEKFVCPTITSSDLTRRPAFRFKADDRPHVVFLIGEDEYKTETRRCRRSPRRARAAGRARARSRSPIPKTPHDFPGVEALDDADLLVVERPPPCAARGRADEASSASTSTRASRSSGIRTACHAFDTRARRRQACRVDDVRSRRPGRPLHRPSRQRLKPRSTSARGRGKAIRSSRACETPFTGQARSTRPARWRPRRPAADRARSPVSRRAGRLGQPARASRASSTRRWAIPTTSRTPRSAGCCATPSSGRSIADPARRRASHPGRHAARKPPGPGLASSPARPSRAFQDARRPPASTWSSPSRCPPAGLLNFDERGRLWVVQYLQYPAPGRPQDAQPRQRLAGGLRQGPAAAAQPRSGARTRSRSTRTPTATAYSTSTRPSSTA